MGCSPSTASPSSRVSPSPDALHRRKLSITHPCEEGHRRSFNIRSLLSRSSSSSSRRLQVSGVDDVAEADALSRAFEVEEGVKGRRWSIASTTDSDLHHREAYKDKDTRVLGGLPGRNSGIGYACKKGLKPESPNQDSFLIMNVDDDFTVYGVFDGHGLHGHNVSNFVKEQLVKLILEHPKESIQEGAQLDKALRTWFPAIQDKLELATKSGELDASCSGSTSTLCVHCHGTDTITAAWVGDSRAVLAYGSSPTVVEMTTDHRPERPQERARIEKTGGRVGYDGHCCYRVYVRGHSYPGLNMSRAMGDLIAYYRAGVIPTPDTRRKQVVRDPERSSPSGLSYVSNNFSWHPGDPFLLVCSDGVWEFISSDEAVSLVSMILTSSSQAQEAAEFLAKKACRRWLDQGGGVVIDDITVIVSCLMPHPRSPRSPQYY